MNSLLSPRHGDHGDDDDKKFPIHGLLMWTCYLVLFPLGTLLIRTTASAPKSSSKPTITTSKGRSSSPFSKLPSFSLGSITPFTCHWIPQAIATILSLTGATIGLSHTHWSRPKSLHTILGSLISISLIIQVLLGWRHHIAFLRIRQRTWMARVHIWLGRTILLLGWTNILVGMNRHKHEILGVSAIVLVAGVILLEAIGLGVWIWMWSRGKRLRKDRVEMEGDGEEGVGLTARSGSGNANGRTVGDEYFSLGGMSDDEGEEDDLDEDKKRKSGEITSRGVA